MPAKFSRNELALIAGAAAVVFTRVFAFSLVLPGLRDFADPLPGATDLLVGAALGAYGLTMALSQLGNGILSDRLGRRPVLLLGTLTFVAGSLWAAVATSIWTLLAARLLQGLGGVSSVAMAAVGETVPEERRTTAMAMIGIPAGLGFFLGFALGPWLADAAGFRALFWMTAALGALAVLPLVLRPLPVPVGVGTVGDKRSLTLPVLALAAAGFAINFGMNEVSFFLRDIPIGTPGLTVALVVAFVVMGAASRAIDRKGVARPAILACLAALAVGAAAFVLAGSAAAAIAAGAVFFAAHAVLSAVLPSQVSRIAGRSGGRGHGIQLVVAYLGSAAGGLAAGAFAQRPFLALASLGAVAVLAAALITRGLRAPAAPPMEASA